MVYETATTDEVVDRLATANDRVESLSTDRGVGERDDVDRNGGFLSGLLN